MKLKIMSSEFKQYFVLRCNLGQLRTPEMVKLKSPGAGKKRPPID